MQFLKDSFQCRSQLGMEPNSVPEGLRWRRNDKWSRVGRPQLHLGDGQRLSCDQHQSLASRLNELGIHYFYIICILLLLVKNLYLDFVWVLVCQCIFFMCVITLKDNTSGLFQNYNAQVK